jgi:methyl-accepting chemotaxis protein
MEGAIARITKVSSETMQSMDSIFKEISAMNDSFKIIHQAVEEQSVGGDQILQGLKMIHHMTDQVQNETGAIHQESDMIHKEVESLKSISHEVKGQVQEMRLASSHIAGLMDKAKALVHNPTTEKH